MIEIPESVNLAKQFAEAFMGKQVRCVEANHSAHGFGWYNLEPQAYPQLLEGKVLTSANALAGQLELVFEDMHLVFNDGTTPHYLHPDDASPQKHQLLLRFEDGSGFYCTVRMYGGMALYPQGETDNRYYLVSRDSPSPLTEEFTREYFQAIVDAATSKLSAKALLATDQRIPGLGNGALQDILFNAQVHPQKKVADLGKEELDTLYESIKTTLGEMTTAGGRDTEKDLYGIPGGYTTLLSNKTKDEPCPNCGSALVRKAYLGGNVYFCPTCQPL